MLFDCSLEPCIQLHFAGPVEYLLRSFEETVCLNSLSYLFHYFVLSVLLIKLIFFIEMEFLVIFV